MCFNIVANRRLANFTNVTSRTCETTDFSVDKTKTHAVETKNAVIVAANRYRSTVDEIKAVTKHSPKIKIGHCRLY